MTGAGPVMQRLEPRSGLRPEVEPARVARPVWLVALTHPGSVGVLGLLAVGYLTAVDPAQPGHYPICPFRLVTGRYCPGCGGLRALHDVFHGHLLAALSSNLLVVLAFPAVIGLWAAWVWGRLSGSGRADRVRIPGWLCWSLVACMLVFGVLRNLPATSWLAP